jgi:hypothetical protein
LVFLATTQTAKYVMLVFGEDMDRIIDRDRELSVFDRRSSDRAFSRFAEGAILSDAEGNPYSARDASLRAKIAVALATMPGREYERE